MGNFLQKKNGKRNRKRFVLAQGKIDTDFEFLPLLMLMLFISFRHNAKKNEENYENVLL